MINMLFALLLPSVISVAECNKIYGEANNIQKIVERYLKSI